MNKLLISAATAYYNGHNLIMSDEDYDKLLNEAKLEDPNFNIFDHIVIGTDRSSVEHPIEYVAQAYKQQFSDMNEFYDYRKSSNLIWTYKMDGCSITAYYDNGILVDILTRSDEECGKRKYDQLKNKVPATVDKSVIKIDFEAVCSREDFDDDVRSNANGLINSCHKQDEVDEYIKLVPFKVTCDPTVCTDYLKSFELANIECKILVSDSIKFDDRYVNIDGKHYPIDGFVGYKNTVDSHEIWKHYSNQEIITTVTDIEWSFKDNSWAFTPKVVYDPIMIDGRVCSKATSNGFNNLRSKKCGIGSQIDVFLANSTIPMVGNVYKESEDYGVPEGCPFCGSKLEEVQAKLRCSNKFCKKLVHDSLWYMFDEAELPDYRDLIPELVDIDEAEKLIRSCIESKAGTVDKLVYGVARCIIIERFNRYDDISDAFKNNLEYLMAGNSAYDIVEPLLTWKQAEVYDRHSHIVNRYLNVIFGSIKNELQSL